MFWKKRPADEPKEPMDLPGSLRGHADGDPVRDALASILRTLGELSLPTIAVSREEFVLSCDRLARAILVGPSKLEQEQSMDLKHACGQARSTVRKQRQAESKEYAAHKEGATIIVADLVSNLKTALAQRSDGDAEVVRQLNSIEQAVSIGNLEEIRRVSSIAASGIRKMLSEQQARDEERLACLSQKLVEMKSELDEAKAEAILDPLTELTNRAGLERALEDALAASRAGASDLTLYMIDIDFFKKVNDAYGHPAGDEVLRKVSRQLIRAFPRKDDVVARFGGEEFVALCRSVGEEHAPMLAERARASVEKLLIDTENDTVAVTISIGFAVHRRGESGAEILKRADAALYEAKRGGRNRCMAAP